MNDASGSWFLHQGQWLLFIQQSKKISRQKVLVNASHRRSVSCGSSVPSCSIRWRVVWDTSLIVWSEESGFLVPNCSVGARGDKGRPLSSKSKWLKLIKDGESTGYWMRGRRFVVLFSLIAESSPHPGETEHPGRRLLEELVRILTVWLSCKTRSSTDTREQTSATTKRKRIGPDIRWLYWQKINTEKSKWFQ